MNLKDADRQNTKNVILMQRQWVAGMTEPGMELTTSQTQHRHPTIERLSR